MVYFSNKGLLVKKSSTTLDEIPRFEDVQDVHLTKMYKFPLLLSLSERFDDKIRIKLAWPMTGGLKIVRNSGK